MYFKDIQITARIIIILNIISKYNYIFIILEITNNINAKRCVKIYSDINNIRTFFKYLPIYILNIYTFLAILHYMYFILYSKCYKSIYC